MEHYPQELALSLRFRGSGCLRSSSWGEEPPPAVDKPSCHIRFRRRSPGRVHPSPASRWIRSQFSAMAGKSAQNASNQTYIGTLAAIVGFLPTRRFTKWFQAEQDWNPSRTATRPQLSPDSR